MPSDLPTSESRFALSTLLSQALVAFTIEFDNEFEHRMPHRTTNFGSTAGAVQAPWLVSMVMWMNCMQYIPEAGITTRELYRESHVGKRNLRAILTGMQRWGYLRVERSSLTKDVRSAASDSVQLTPAGRNAHAICRPLLPEIEERWRKRFGERQITELRKALSAVMEQFESQLPQGMPIVGYGLVTGAPERESAKSKEYDVSTMSLPGLLSGVLTMFAIEFEHESPISLAVSANVIRVLDGNGVLVKELPRLSAISKEAIAISLNFLQKRGCIVIEEGSKGKLRIARLTAKGVAAQTQYWKLVSELEVRWRGLFGEAAINSLRKGLEELTGNQATDKSKLLRGIMPHPAGWRAKNKSSGLPHFPVVTHRGGFPDGS